jgi:hypothetical protein
MGVELWNCGERVLVRSIVLAGVAVAAVSADLGAQDLDIPIGYWTLAGATGRRRITTDLGLCQWPPGRLRG